MVIVGSGAGGSVIAAECARAGKSVLVLEMGQYKNEQDFNQLEVQGYQEMYYGGGLAASESGSISVLAGSTLGGGTVVNYMNCIPTPGMEDAGESLAAVGVVISLHVGGMFLPSPVTGVSPTASGGCRSSPPVARRSSPPGRWPRSRPATRTS